MEDRGPRPISQKTTPHSHEVVYHTLPTVYQHHIHTIRKERRPTPTHGTKYTIGISSRGATLTTHARQDSGRRNLVGYNGPESTVTRIRGDTRATHTKTNQQTAPSSCAQIRLLL